MASSTDYIGWGSGPWGRDNWGSSTTTIFVDGVAATGQLGSVSLITNNVISVTGLEATGAVGSVAV